MRWRFAASAEKNLTGEKPARACDGSTLSIRVNRNRPGAGPLLQAQLAQSALPGLPLLIAQLRDREVVHRN